MRKLRTGTLVAGALVAGLAMGTIGIAFAVEGETPVVDPAPVVVVAPDTGSTDTTVAPSDPTTDMPSVPATETPAVPTTETPSVPATMTPSVPATFTPMFPGKGSPSATATIHSRRIGSPNHPGQGHKAKVKKLKAPRGSSAAHRNDVKNRVQPSVVTSSAQMGRRKR